MLITLSVPDNTVEISYVTQSEEESGYIDQSSPKRITFDMIMKVEQE